MYAWLLILVAVLGQVLASRENQLGSAVELDLPGHGWRAKVSLNYDEVVSCLFETLDIKPDQALTSAEIQRGLASHMSWTEQFHSGLSMDTLMRLCDRDGDGRIQYSEMIAQDNGERCLSTAQEESVARYICSRKKHKDMVAADYKNSYTMWMKAFHDGTIKETVAKQMNNLDHVINPHRGRRVGSRVELPSEDESRVGEGFPPQLIIALGLLFIGVVIVVAVL